MTKLGICTGIVLAVAGASWAVDVRAAEITPMKAPPAASAPKSCTGLWDFIDTNCQLTWQGITVYGTIDAGVGWQSHGAPFDPRSAVSASYLIQKQNRSPIWTLAPNALSNSTIGIKGTKLIAGDLSAVFAVDAGFDPYSFRLSDGPGSVAANAGIPQNQATAYSDSTPARMRSVLNSSLIDSRSVMLILLCVGSDFLCDFLYAQNGSIQRAQKPQ